MITKNRINRINRINRVFRNKTGNMAVYFLTEMGILIQIRIKYWFSLLSAKNGDKGGVWMDAKQAKVVLQKTASKHKKALYVTENGQENLVESSVLPRCIICGKVPENGIMGGIFVKRHFICECCEKNIVALNRETQPEEQYFAIVGKLKQLWKLA